MSRNDDKIRKRDILSRIGGALGASRYSQTGKKLSFDGWMEVLGIEEKRSVIEWRNRFSKFMIGFLCVQYVFIVVFLLLQGFRLGSFQLDSGIFYILISGTFVQSCFLVRIIFRYMFNYRQ